MRFLLCCLLAGLLLLPGGMPQAYPYPAWPPHHIPDGTPFSMPQPSTPVRDIYVDPIHGNDETGSGDSPSSALRTLSAAWDKIPQGRLNRGSRITLMAGTFQEDMAPSYWEGRWGSPDAPIILTSLSGADPHSVTVPAINMFNCTHVFFLGFTIASAYETLHFDRCVGMHLRRMRVLGNTDGSPAGGATYHAYKANQAAGIYLEECEVAGAANVAVDYVSVQYGHIVRSNVHDGNWCMNLKGGSAYLLVDGNTVFNCGESGLAAGQGTGLQYMLEPWVQYEAYAIRITNNLIRDVWGAGLGVWGGYQILMAHNTLLRVGSRSHTVEFNFGGRACNADDTEARCAQLAARGAWGPSSSSDEGVSIPSRDILFLNNVVYNPPGKEAKWAHFSIAEPEPAAGSVPGPYARADEGLVVAGNVFWNGGPDMSVAPDAESCPQAAPASPIPAAGAPFCHTARFRAFNLFNPAGVDPAAAFVVPPGPDARVPPGSLLALSPLLVAPLYAFPPWSAQTGAPPGSAPNEAPLDILDRVRAGGFNAIGAYAVQGAPQAPSEAPIPGLPAGSDDTPRATTPSQVPSAAPPPCSSTSGSRKKGKAGACTPATAPSGKRPRKRPQRH